MSRYSERHSKWSKHSKCPHLDAAAGVASDEQVARLIDHEAGDGLAHMVTQVHLHLQRARGRRPHAQVAVGARGEQRLEARVFEEDELLDGRSGARWRWLGAAHLVGVGEGGGIDARGGAPRDLSLDTHPRGGGGVGRGVDSPDHQLACEGL